MCSSPLNKLMEPNTVSRAPPERGITVLLGLLAVSLPRQRCMRLAAVATRARCWLIFYVPIRPAEDPVPQSCSSQLPAWLWKRRCCIVPRVSVSGFPRVYRMQSKNTPHAYALSTQQVIWSLTDTFFFPPASYHFLPLWGRGHGTFHWYFSPSQSQEQNENLSCSADRMLSSQKQKPLSTRKGRKSYRAKAFCSVSKLSLAFTKLSKVYPLLLPLTRIVQEWFKNKVVTVSFRGRGLYGFLVKPDTTFGHSEVSILENESRNKVPRKGHSHYFHEPVWVLLLHSYLIADRGTSKGNKYMYGRNPVLFYL